MLNLRRRNALGLVARITAFSPSHHYIRISSSSSLFSTTTALREKATRGKKGFTRGRGGFQKNRTSEGTLTRDYSVDDVDNDGRVSRRGSYFSQKQQQQQQQQPQQRGARNYGGKGKYGSKGERRARPEDEFRSEFDDYPTSRSRFSSERKTQRDYVENRGGARGSRSVGRALWAIHGESRSEETEPTSRNREDGWEKENQESGRSGRRTREKSVERKDKQDEAPVLNNYHRPDRGTKFPEEVLALREMDQDDDNVKAEASKIRDRVFAYAFARPTVRSTVRPTIKAPESQSLKANGDIDEVELELDMDSDSGARDLKKNTKKNDPKKDPKDESKKFFKDRPRTRDGAEITDPYLISKYIKGAIERGNLDVALENARRGGEHSTTGWNYIIQHAMSEAKVNTALSYFNEMRRRGAKPNGYTFTALFQGLANHSAITPTAIDKTKRILAYAVHKGTFKLEPVLLNAALQVARVNRDMDAMYEILGIAMDVIPLDAASYSIIFNIYSNAGRSNRELGSEIREIWAEAVSEAKRSQRLSNGRVVLFNSVIYNVTRALLKSKSQADVYLAYRILVNAYNLPQYIVPTELLVSNIIQDPSAVEDTALAPYLCNDSSDESRLYKAPIEKTAVPFIFEACDRLRQRDAFVEYHSYFKRRIYLGSSLHMKYTEQMDENGLPAVGTDVVADTVPEVTRKDRRLQKRLYAQENNGKKLPAQEADEDDD